MTETTTPGILDIAIAVTIFPDRSALELEQWRLPLSQLADWIRNQHADTKERLPLLKLGSFGELRTAKQCLRHDANLMYISGVEGEHDDGTVSLDDAEATLRRHGIAAVLYSSPSYNADAPRWRVLCPTSQPLFPLDREPLVARLNGAMAGVITLDSFKLSQSFYFGSVRNNLSHEVRLVDGAPIDLLDKLDKHAIGKDGGKLAKRRRYEAPPPIADCTDGYIAAALRRGTDQVMCAIPGRRNNSLNKECFTLGRFVAGRRLSQATLVHEMTVAALRAGLERDEIATTIESGIRSAVETFHG